MGLLILSIQGVIIRTIHVRLQPASRTLNLIFPPIFIKCPSSLRDCPNVAHLVNTTRTLTCLHCSIIIINVLVVDTTDMMAFPDQLEREEGSLDTLPFKLFVTRASSFVLYQL